MLLSHFVVPLPYCSLRQYNNLKYFLVIALFLALLAQQFSKPIVLADYMVNLDRYKKDCVNKARPLLHCNGRCQMKKKLEAQDDQQERRSSSPKLIELDYVLSSKSFFPEVEVVDDSTLASFPSGNTSIRDSFVGDIFHPPTFTA